MWYGQDPLTNRRVKNRFPTPRSWLAACLAGLLVSCARRPEPADFVLRRGRIVTLDAGQPTAEALAARAGRIVAVGTEAQIERYIGRATRVLDIPGLVAIPGLIEGHGHFMRFGDVLMQLDLRHARSWDAIVEKVGQVAAQAPPDQWIVGWGWHQDKWDRPPEPSVEGLPRHESLSQASPRNPVFLAHTSGHGVFVNARALEIAGITRATRNPAGGEIVRDARGHPIGMLREAAAQPVRDALAKARAARPPEVIEAEERGKVKLAAAAALASGITSFQDMGSSFQTIDLLKKMADEGALPDPALRRGGGDRRGDEGPAGRLPDGRPPRHPHGASDRREGPGRGARHARRLAARAVQRSSPQLRLQRHPGGGDPALGRAGHPARLPAGHPGHRGPGGARPCSICTSGRFRAHPEKTDRRWRIEHAQVIHPDDMPRWKQLGVIAADPGHLRLLRRTLGGGAAGTRAGPGTGLPVPVDGRRGRGGDERNRPAGRGDRSHRQLRVRR